MGTTPSDLSDTEKLQRLRALDMAGETQSAADYLLTLDVPTLERLHALALLDPSTEMAAPVISLARLMVMMESAV